MNIESFEENNLYGLNDDTGNVLAGAKYKGLKIEDNCCVLIQNSSGTYSPPDGVFILKSNRFTLTNYESDFSLIFGGNYGKILINGNSEWDVFKVSKDEGF